MSELENNKYKVLINDLKKANDAIILAHYYQNDEIQEIADFVGDSFQLSIMAKKTNAKVIIFCGVHFMAETAKILSPEKEVIIPVKEAGCYMADTIKTNELMKYKENHPNDVIISYVNTTAEIKALSDVCVTSANAEKIINHYKEKKIMYIPDQNLANYVNDKYGYKMDYWHGYCDIHHHLTIEMVEKIKTKHPLAKVLIHPESPLEVTKRADYIGSTKGMIDFVSKDSSKEYIIGTEKGILYSLRKNFPDRIFYLLDESLLCKSMKMTHLKNVYDALLKQGDAFEIITIDKEIINKAKTSLEKMIELSGK